MEEKAEAALEAVSLCVRVWLVKRRVRMTRSATKGNKRLLTQKKGEREVGEGDKGAKRAKNDPLCALTVCDHFTFREYPLHSRLTILYPLQARRLKSARNIGPGVEKTGRRPY